MNEVTVLFAPGFAAATTGLSLFFQLQALAWLNQTFKCHSFKLVTHDADVYVYTYDATKIRGGFCEGQQASSYYGCYYSDQRIALNHRLYAFGDDAALARKYVITHEFEHYFQLPNHYKLKKTTKQIYEQRYCQ